MAAEKNEKTLAVFDLEKFMENYSDLGPFLPQLIEKFRSSYPNNMNRMRSALEASDPEALRAAAHGLKGMLLQVFANDSRNMAAELERMGSEKNLQVASVLFQKLSAEMALLDSALVEVLSTLPKI